MPNVIPNNVNLCPLPAPTCATNRYPYPVVFACIANNRLASLFLVPPSDAAITMSPMCTTSTSNIPYRDFIDYVVRQYTPATIYALVCPFRTSRGEIECQRTPASSQPGT